jgi:hypothetical protein
MRQQGMVTTGVNLKLVTAMCATKASSRAAAELFGGTVLLL